MNSKKDIKIQKETNSESSVFKKADKENIKSVEDSELAARDVEAFVGAYDENGKRVFLVKVKGSKDYELISHEEALKHPIQLIKFYEDRMIFPKRSIYSDSD